MKSHVKVLLVTCAFGMLYVYFLLELLNPSNAYANTDLIVICNEADCFTDTTFPLFDVNNWAPGKTSTSNITVKNERSDNCNLQMQTKNEVEIPKGFTKNVFVSIRKDSRVIYGSTNDDSAITGKTMHNIFVAKHTKLGTINSNSTGYYTWMATLNPQAGNEFQSANASFNFSLTFECSSTIPDEVIPKDTASTQITDKPEPKDKKNPSSNSESNNTGSDESSNSHNSNNSQNLQKFEDSKISQNSGPLQASNATLDTKPSQTSFQKTVRVLGAQTSKYLENNPTKAQKCADNRIWFLVFFGQSAIYLLSALLFHPKNKAQYFIYLSIAAIITGILRKGMC